MTRERREVEGGLKKKGFRKVSTHHRYYVYQTADGRITRIRTKVSHGGKSRDISSFHIAQMVKQCHLTKAQFLELVDCPMKQPAYENILRDEGLV